MNRCTGLCILLLINCSLAGSNVRPQHWMGLEVGKIFPLQGLADFLEPAPFARLLIAWPYPLPALSLYTGLAYARLDGPQSPASLHHALGQFGLGWRGGCGGLASGVGLYYVRAQSKRTDQDLLLDDNESEFGWFFRAESPRLTLGRKKSLGIAVEIHRIWTLPQPSHLFWSGLSMEFVP